MKLFGEQGRGRVLVVGLFLLVNGLVFANAVLHDPSVGYDSGQHLRYIEILAQGRLPALEDSKEFFSPPLPYLLPAFVLSTENSSLWAATKTGQFLNVGFSLGLTLVLLALCEWVRPGSTALKALSLAVLGVMPVYYKSFAMVRGEPLVAFFAVGIVYLTLRIFVDGKLRARYVAALGVLLGLVVLARQWGFFLFPAVGLFVGGLGLKRGRHAWWGLAIPFGVAVGVAALVGGWFYLGLLSRYGTVTAFNRDPHQRFALSNQPAAFYFGLGLDGLFTRPIRGAFPNEFIPMFYSEFWGDYWGYFVLAGRDTRDDTALPGAALEFKLVENPPPAWLVTNGFTIGGYLGRVNLVSLPISALLLAALGLGAAALARFARQAAPSRATDAWALFGLVALTSLAGYAWFLIEYPIPSKGDTIKATYMLHLYPLLAILAGEVGLRLRTAAPRAFVGGLLALALTFAHNLPAMLTHYIPWNLLAYYPPFRYFTGWLPWH